MFFPADLLDLSRWALTLPTGVDDEPTEIFPADLSTFTHPPYFQVNRSGTAVWFRANAGGVTTAGSGYARTELREMTAMGERAAWSTNVGEHTMTITQAITHVPEVKPHVVAGQVHDGSDDVVVFRLEGERLMVETEGDPLVELDPSYTLGEVFTVRFVAANGQVAVYYEDMTVPVARIPVDADTCYFKAGAYTQSNEEMGDRPDAYGEVAIYDLVVTHR
ncbi:MAG: polysaccharide lyase family 7 protein [Myxococcota bacterium]